MYLRVRINIPKAGLTQAVMEKIHDTWRKEELVRLKFHERRTGGMVIWRAGSVMVVYRGRDYQGPSAVFNQMARPEEHYQGPSAGSVLVYSYVTLMREDEATLGKITKPRRPKTVVLCPTRELSEQFKLVCCSFFLFPCRKTLQRFPFGPAMPVFTFANQAGLDMLETTLVSLQDISLEKIFDDNGRKTLCSEFPQIMQQAFASLQGGICLSSMGRPVSYERAVAWKVLNEEENAHCICFVFINWSFV
ncbi:hypothetical protein HID58_015362 [Brassica napus]|uniref:CRM domain-containing protein n=1 Tax=Brassica napus TaxID=3708 RepID=A0ABQ8DMC8_BRANA|nr:hypothetical protein HID58_015362 [Brassica napus]